jgi:hypothetical protein
MLYHEDVSLTSTAGVVSRYFYSANAAYDPNITGTGHSAMGFDQLMLLYEQYTVVSSKMSATFINASTGFYTRCCLSLTPDTTSISDKDEILENGLLKTVILNPINVNGSVKTLTLSCDITKYFGRTRSVRELLDDNSLFGTVSANPTEQVYFCLNIWDPNAANTTTLYCDLMIEYDTIFWEPRKLATS